MGSPLSPIIADIFMVDLEERAIAGAGEDIAPSVWKRYVDDVLSVVKRDKGQLLLDHLNKQHEKIRFTMEEERDGSLPFTDISFSRDEYGQVVREVYRKPTHTNRYVQFTSHHPESVKSGVIDCLVKRAATVSSNDELLGKELDKIREAMNQNNYPKHFVKKAIEKRNEKKKNATPTGTRVRSRWNHCQDSVHRWIESRSQTDRSHCWSEVCFLCTQHNKATLQC